MQATTRVSTTTIHNLLFADECALNTAMEEDMEHGHLRRRLHQLWINNKILKLRWQDGIPDTEVLDHTGILSIHAMLRQLQLRWTDHLVRMDDERQPRRLFYGDVTTGARRQGDPKRYYKDTLMKSLKQLQINLGNREDLAMDIPAWRRFVKTGAAIYEANRITAAKAKIAPSKSPAPPINIFDAQALPTYPRCQRIFSARIGLRTHSSTHHLLPPPPPSPSLPLPPPPSAMGTLS
ncbi:unnamed protein product [Schistocephalus solidus]|uniref:Reverse transcriptase domain-containing protein n=1 Tax=Schistocephalus solidus TaxID=70667 RepID=A0A183T8E6_SCHSO|nr:unnamed protein product [Schistocephalus solidus]